jgi:hypothetical protein
MSKHIKTSRGRPVDPPKHENWKRRQRRKRLKARQRPEFIAAWADRPPFRNTAEMSV